MVKRTWLIVFSMAENGVFHGRKHHFLPKEEPIPQSGKRETSS
jgi:hypothetical protein